MNSSLVPPVFGFGVLGFNITMWTTIIGVFSLIVLLASTGVFNETLRLFNRQNYGVRDRRTYANLQAFRTNNSVFIIDLLDITGYSLHGMFPNAALAVCIINGIVYTGYMKYQPYNNTVNFPYHGYSIAINKVSYLNATRNLIYFSGTVPVYTQLVPEENGSIMHVKLANMQHSLTPGAGGTVQTWTGNTV